MDPHARSETEKLLSEASHGNQAAAAKLVPLVYTELKSLAARYLRREGPERSIQVTSLVHEAYLRLVDFTRIDWKSRAHFLAVSAAVMRNVLVDHARRQNAAKRGGEWGRLALDVDEYAARESDVDILELEDLLAKLACLDERQAKIVELRFFGGLTHDEVAQVLGVSPTTVEGDWRLARAWLRARLEPEG